MFGRLYLQPWWHPGAYPPEPAWAIEWLNPDGDDPPMRVALVRAPGVAPATEADRDELVSAADVAKQGGDEAVAPPAGPIDQPDWRELASGLDRVFSAWVDSETGFPAGRGARSES
ncbi:MAG: hypothetical protein ACLP0J_25585 [Solirubrobacteraceae bacterium]